MANNIVNDSAGVFTRLEDLSQFGLSASETKIGIIGVADKGPLNIPTLLRSQNDLIDIFEKPSLDGYGGLSAFLSLNETNQVYFTRIATSAARASSGVIQTPAASAQITSSNFANYSFGYSRSNEQFLVSLNNDPVVGIEFVEGVYNTEEVVTILQAFFVGKALISDVSGNINITSLETGTNSSIRIIQSSALTELGFTAGTTTGINATAGSVSTGNANGTWVGTPFNSADSLVVEFDGDVNLTVNLTGAFIDGITNVVDLVDTFNSFAGNNVNAILGSAASVTADEQVLFTSPTTGTTSSVKILSSTSSSVESVLNISGSIDVLNSGTDATSATITSSDKQGYDLSSATTLKFNVDTKQKDITFSTTGTSAYSTYTYVSGTALGSSDEVLVDDWTFRFTGSSGLISSLIFGVDGGADSVESFTNLTAAINDNVSTVTVANSYPGGAGASGTMTVTAVAQGTAGNSITFDTTDIEARVSYVSKDPTDQTLGYGNGSSLTSIDDVELSDVVYEINRQAGGIYAVASNGKVKLKSNVLGSASSITINGSNTSMGFVSGDIDTGENAGDFISVQASSTGKWGDSITATTIAGGLNVYRNSVLVETWTGDTINASSNFIQSVINANSDYVTVEYLGGVGDAITAGLTTTLEDGDSGAFVTDQEVVNAIDLYSDSEQLDVNLFATPGYSSTAVLTALNALANTRQDLFILVDPPVGLNVSQVVNWHNGIAGSGNTLKLDNKYMGIYYPWLRMTDEQNGLVRLVPPSVLVIERTAKNDNDLPGPWFATAGTSQGNLERASDVERILDLADRDELYSTVNNVNTINPIINILGRGIVIWGQKTTQRALTALNRVNVARLTVRVRRRITDIAKDLVFQPNDEVSWQTFVARANKYLDTVRSARGISRYEVKMDATLNTPTTIAQGKLFGTISFTPVIVAEQIILTFKVESQEAGIEIVDVAA